MHLKKSKFQVHLVFKVFCFFCFFKRKVNGVVLMEEIMGKISATWPTDQEWVTL